MLTKSGQLIMLEAKTKPSCTACWAHNHSYYLTYPAYCMLSILPNSFKCVWFYPDWNVPIFKNIFASFSPLSPRYLALRALLSSGFYSINMSFFFRFCYAYFFDLVLLRFWNCYSQKCSLFSQRRNCSYVSWSE